MYAEFSHTSTGAQFLHYTQQSVKFPDIHRVAECKRKKRNIETNHYSLGRLLKQSSFSTPFQSIDLKGIIYIEGCGVPFDLT
jgi:hypothetical protein